jgi:hypothetical protein
MAWKKVVRSMVVLGILSGALVAQSEAKTFEECSLPVQGGLVVSSLLVSGPYCISKMLYAVNGSIVAGGINVLSLGFAQDIATMVGYQAVNGDWIVLPQVFTQERRLEFIGKDEPIEGLTLTMKQEE